MLLLLLLLTPLLPVPVNRRAALKGDKGVSILLLLLLLPVLLYRLAA